MSNERCNISLSLPQIACFGGMPCKRVGRYRAPQPRLVALRVACGSGVRGFVVLGVCGKWVISLSKTSIRPWPAGSHRFRQSDRQWIVTLVPCAQWKKLLYASMWYMISPLLTTDDAVMLRTVTSRWNEGNRYGALGYAFFMMLKLDQYEKK